MRLLIVLALFSVLVGCPKTSSTETSGDQAIEEAPKKRFSGATGRFVDGLLASPIIGWAVNDGGAEVVYEELVLSEDGAFRAKTTVRLGDEPFECTESGTWTLDDNRAESATVGNLNFEVESTDCAGREAPKTFRAEATLSGDDVNLESR